MQMVFEMLRNNKRWIVALGVVLAILGFITYSFIAPGGMFSGLQNDLKIIETAEGSSYTTLDGVVIDLQTFKGKPLIINSWATWMPFSKDELFLLTTVKELYGNDIEVIAINRMENVGVVRSYLSTYAITETVSFLLDPADSFYRAIEGYAMPETLFYSKDGTLVMHKRGVLTKEELEQYAELISK